MKGFYFITNSSISKAGDLSDVKNAVAAGVEAVLLWNKSSLAGDLYREALELKFICSNTLLIINDRIDIALAIDADGIHLGKDDLPYFPARKLLGKNRIIGLTVHNLDEAVEAEKIGADYVSVSPGFNTNAKQGTEKPSGITLIEAIKKTIAIPVVAVGGITLSNAPDVVKAGADCICSVSQVVTKDDVKAEIEKFQRLIKIR